jgi:hypothetical protein
MESRDRSARIGANEGEERVQGIARCSRADPAPVRGRVGADKGETDDPPVHVCDRRIPATGPEIPVETQGLITAAICKGNGRGRPMTIVSRKR